MAILHAHSAEPPSRALILSPLLNLASGPASGAALIQHVEFHAKGMDAPSGEATLSLSRDRQRLTVSIEDYDGQQSLEVRVRRLGNLATKPFRGADGELRVIEVERRPRDWRSVALRQEIVLADGAAYAPLSRSDHRPLPPALVDSIRAEAILGLSVEPAVQAGPRLSYLERRLMAELAAAAAATLPLAACRHVELATLYLRELQGRPASAQA